MRQADAHGPRIRVGLVRGHPRDLRRGVAGKDEVPGELENAAVAAERPCELGALGRGRRVVPQLCRACRTIAAVEAHEAVLLPGHADAADVESLTAQRIADRAPERVDPPAGVLLARTVIAFDELVWRATHGEDTAGRRVAQYDFGRLRAAVHAEKDTSHFSCRRGRRNSGVREPTPPCRRSSRPCGR